MKDWKDTGKERNSSDDQCSTSVLEIRKGIWIGLKKRTEDCKIAQFKIRSFIGVRNGIPMGRLLCCTISLASSWSLWDVQLIWRALIGFNWKWRNTSPVHVFSAVSWATLFFGEGKSICVKYAWLLKLSQLSKFFHGRRRKNCFRSSERKVVSTHLLRADFTQQSSLRSSHGSLRKTNAFLQQKVSLRFMFTHKTYCLLNCWLYGIGIRFSPNNLKRKALCGNHLLEYVQVNKIMQKLWKRKVRKHLRVLPRKVFQNRQACHLLQSVPCSIFAPMKSLFHQFKTSIYSKKCCLQLLSKRKQVVSSGILCIETLIIYKQSWLGNRETKSESKTQ